MTEKRARKFKVGQRLVLVRPAGSWMAVQKGHEAVVVSDDGGKYVKVKWDPPSRQTDGEYYRDRFEAK